MIYTAVVGNRDFVREDIRCFTVNKWFSNPRVAAKIYKVMPDLYSGDRTSVWLDANIYTYLSEEQLVEKYLGDADIALFKHPFRDNVMDELNEVVKLEIETMQNIVAFKDYYGSGLLMTTLYEAGVIIRRNNAASTRLGQIWWSLICRFSERDQLTLPIAIRFSGVKLAIIEPGDVRKNPDFLYRKHQYES